MRKAGLRIELAWFLFSAAVIVFAQSKDAPKHYGKGGLWEVTTAITWQKTPPVRMGGPGSPPANGSHTSEICLSQDMVDAGALLPQSRGQCHIQNKVVKPGSLTADYTCTGKMKGTGNLETDFPDLEHVTGSIHFVGTMDVQGHARPIEWTETSKAVFKSAQCANSSPAAPANPPK